MPLPPPPRPVPLLPEAYSSVEFLSRLSLAHSQWSGKPSVPPHLAASLLFPPAALAHITAALLGVSAYCHAAVFDKLLLFQHLWNLDGDNRANTLPAVVRVAANAVAASQGLALTAPPADEAEPFVLGATIHRLYTTLLASLDREARLFFMLLPVPPPSAPDLRPIPPEALRQWFLVDLPGCAPCMQHVKDARQHKPQKRPAAEGQAAPEPEPEDADDAAVAGGGLNGDELLPVSRRNVRLNVHAPGDADHCDYTAPAAHVDDAGKRVFPTPIAFDPAWLARTFLEPASWAPLLLSVVDLHPGLEFLSSAGDFQQRYAQTVIARLYYATNPRGDDRMQLRHLRNSDLIQRLDVLWGNEDVNRAHDYFSYEHFYVLYCKFWELDADHDMLLQPSDLVMYEDGALSSLVLQRVSDPYATLQPGEPAPVLTYEQFVSFCIAEVDKASRRAIRYWLRRVDLDTDGLVGPDDIFQLLSEQVRRVRDAAGESVNIRDLSCQLWDMLGVQRAQPTACTLCQREEDEGHAHALAHAHADGAEADPSKADPSPSPEADAETDPSKPPLPPSRLSRVPQSGRLSGVLSYSTLRKSGLAATIFDLLFNLTKFVQSEARDVNRIRAQQAGHDEWERWAAQTYYMLAGAEVDAHREQ
jgi:hypothetical protein